MSTRPDPFRKMTKWALDRPGAELRKSYSCARRHWLRHETEAWGGWPGSRGV